MAGQTEWFDRPYYFRSSHLRWRLSHPVDPVGGKQIVFQAHKVEGSAHRCLCQLKPSQGSGRQFFGYCRRIQKGDSQTVCYQRLDGRKIADRRQIGKAAQGAIVTAECIFKDGSGTRSRLPDQDTLCIQFLYGYRPVCKSMIRCTDPPKGFLSIQGCFVPAAIKKTFQQRKIQPSRLQRPQKHLGVVHNEREKEAPGYSRRNCSTFGAITNSPMVLEAPICRESGVGATIASSAR